MARHEFRIGERFRTEGVSATRDGTGFEVAIAMWRLHVDCEDPEDGGE